MGLGETLAKHLETASSHDSSKPTVEVGDELARDNIFHILQTKRRRDVLRYLHEADGPVRMRDLAEQVAAWEQETTIDALTSTERQRVYISLYQSHLPKLDEEGIIEYEKDRGLVERTPVAAQFDPYLAEIVGAGRRTRADQRDRWPRRYAATAALGGSIVLATALEILSISGLVAATTVLGAFSVVTVVHALSRSGGSTSTLDTRTDRDGDQ